MTYLVHDIFKGIGAIDGKADEYDVCLWVGERAQSVVLFLSSSIPQRQLHHLASWRVRRVGNVVLKDSGHVFLLSLAPGNTYMAMLKTHLWEVARAVADQQTCLSAATVPDDD